MAGAVSPRRAKNAPSPIQPIVPNVRHRGNDDEGGEVADEQVAERGEELHEQGHPDHRARTVPVGQRADRHPGDEPDQAGDREAQPHLEAAQVHHPGEIQHQRGDHQTEPERVHQRRKPVHALGTRLRQQ
jgi:hypothetical protein